MAATQITPDAVAAAEGGIGDSSMFDKDFTPINEVAQSYVEAGLGLVNIAEGSKRAKGEAWQKPENAITDCAAAEAMEGSIGIHHLVSRTCALDVDDWEPCSSWFRERGIDMSSLFMDEDAVQIKSGREARGKLLFKLPDEVEWLPYVKTAEGKLELRCANSAEQSQQDVLPPSIHPDTGAAYGWEGDWRSIPTLPEPLLAAWLEEANKETAKAAPVAHKPRGTDESSPIGRFNAEHSPSDILERHGYIPAQCGTRWLYPESTSGDAGVVLIEDSEPPRVYSHHAEDDLADSHAHDAFSLFTVLDHGGDQDAALRAIGCKAVQANADGYLDANGMPLTWDATDKEGQPRNSYINTRRALMLMGIRCRYDKFTDKNLIGGHAVEEYAGEFSDHGVRLLSTAIMHEYGFAPSEELVSRAVLTLATENSFDSLTDHLNSLPAWDGVPRINQWLTTYIGAEDNVYTREVGAKFLTGAIARALRPGCKFDQMLVLEGPQGIRKSTALRCLATGNASPDSGERFTDKALLSSPGGREVLEATSGVWICEAAELDGMSRRDVTELKSFLSRQEDKGRPAYARIPVSRPRRFVLAGTTNESRYLQDDTGNRRFWPVQVEWADTEALAADRDQLFAEALHIYRAGEHTPVLSDEAHAIAQQVQASRRFVEQGWVEALEGIGYFIPTRGAFAGYQVVRNAEVFERLNIDASRRQGRNADQAREAMVALGWTKHPSNVTINGENTRVFYRPIPPSDEDGEAIDEPTDF